MATRIASSDSLLTGNNVLLWLQRTRKLILRVATVHIGTEENVAQPSVRLSVLCLRFTWNPKVLTT